MDIAFMEEEFANSWDREKAVLHVDTLPATAYLALSGGGDKGAFSAGFHTQRDGTHLNVAYWVEWVRAIAGGDEAALRESRNLST